MAEELFRPKQLTIEVDKWYRLEWGHTKRQSCELQCSEVTDRDIFGYSYPSCNYVQIPKSLIVREIEDPRETATAPGCADVIVALIAIGLSAALIYFFLSM